jgi:folylpolyglutamate synthase/dihydropteroate synthase
MQSEKHQDMPAYFRFLTVLALKVFIEEKVPTPAPAHCE